MGTEFLAAEEENGNGKRTNVIELGPEAAELPMSIYSFKKVLHEELNQLESGLEKRFDRIWQRIIAERGRDQGTTCSESNQQILERRLMGLDEKLNQVHKLLEIEVKARDESILLESPDELIIPQDRPNKSALPKIRTGIGSNDETGEPRVPSSSDLSPRADTNVSGGDTGARGASGLSCRSDDALSSVLGDIVLRRVWLAEIDTNTRSVTPLGLHRLSTMALSSSSQTKRLPTFLLDDVKPKRKLKCVLSPSSSKRLVWDLLSIVLIAYDAVWLPLSLSFDPSPSEVTKFPGYMFWVTLLFWTTDIVLSCFTAYYRDGVLVTAHCNIVCNYLKTWFLPDVVIIGLDWMSVFADSGRSGTSLVRMGKSFRVLRVLRSLRLLRLVKVMKILEEIQDRISSDLLQIGLSVLKLTLVLLMFNHMIACTWWGIGSSPAEGQSSWTQFHGMDDEKLGYKYLTSLHWTLTQFTPAGMEVYPHNSGERVFAVIVLLFALIFFSSYLSSITSAMTQLRQLNQATNKQFSLLRRFLKEHHVSQDLAQRIKKYLEHRVHMQRSRIQENHITILQLLSDPLRNELHEEFRRPLLCKHPFFDNYCNLAPHAMRQLCQVALSAISLSEGDLLFTVGASCEQMYFVVQGALMYQWQGIGEESEPETGKSTFSKRRFSKSPSFSSSGILNKRYLQEGDWCSEACLWAQWVHRGHMQAVANCNLVAIDAEKFISVTLKQTLVIQTTSAYAKRFVKDLNESLNINDLPTSREDVMEICRDAFAWEGGWSKADAESKSPPETRSSTSITGNILGGLRALRPSQRTN